MKIKFIGVPGEEHKRIEAFGVWFPLGVPMLMTDPVGMRKLANHPHFKVVDDVQDVPHVPSRATLEALAESTGTKIDKRWSDARLQDEISKAV